MGGKLYSNKRSDAAGKRERKKYFTFEYSTVKLFEYMRNNKDLGPFSVRKLLKFREVHVQRRDRLRQSLCLLIDLGWVRPVPGNPTLYEVTERGEIAYPLARRFLEFSVDLRFGKRRPSTLHPSEDDAMFSREG